VVVQCGKRSGGAAAGLGGARARRLVLVQKSSRGPPFYKGFCFDLEWIRLKIEVGERFSLTGLELSSIHASLPRGRRVQAAHWAASRAAWEIDKGEGGERKMPAGSVMVLGRV
jgi:hypothetical protein